MEKSSRKKRIWPWIVIGVIVVLLVIMVVSCSNAMKKATANSFVTYKTERGDVSLTITGSGKTRSDDSEETDIPDGIEIDEVIAKAGDKVNASSVLATLDIDSVKACAARLSNEIAALDAQLSYKSVQESIDSPVKGRVKYIAANEGDQVVDCIKENGALAVISSDWLMALEIATQEELEVGSEVSVEWDGESEDGTVERRTVDGYIITVDDENAPCDASAKVLLDGEVIGEGVFYVNSPVYVYGTGGTIDDIEVEVGDSVSSGTELFSIDDGPYDAAYLQALRERNEKAEELFQVIGYLSDPVVLAGVDGTVAKTPDSETAGNETAAQYTMQVQPDTSAAEFVIHTGGAVKMVINVDELDIGKVALEQAAHITLDAFPAETFIASVTHISSIGETSGSITTYPVELTLEYDERLLEGMNGSVVITAKTADNVLRIPVEAIYEDEKGEYVYKGKNSASKKRVDITTGISDGTYAEVLTGLNEGDTVIYEYASAFAQMMQLSEEMRDGMMGGGAD